MTITLVAVYAPIGLQGGLTGSLFREFAFTLAGAVFISGVVALTLSPYMSSKLLDAGREEHGLAGRINRGFDRLRRTYGRVLDATLSARPAVYIVWVVLSLLAIPLFMMSPKELAPMEDQGFVMGIVEAAADATIDQTTFYTDAVNRELMSFPETEQTFQITFPDNGFSGLVLKPWGQRKRTVFQIMPELQAKISKFLPAFLLALTLIFLVLAAQFNSFRDPLIILLGSVPLAMFGALLFSFLKMPAPNMAFFTNGWTTTLNIYSQVGLVTLVGLVSKNGILIVEFANELQRRGLGKVEAVREAALVRLRPVLMTSVATVCGHFPLTLVTGAGAAARNSIGITIVAGMALGTLFTLLVIPSIYVLIAKKHAGEEPGAMAQDFDLATPALAGLPSFHGPRPGT